MAEKRTGPPPRRQDKSNASWGRFAVVGQWVTAFRRKGKGGAFPDSPIESTRIAPPMGFSGASARGGRSTFWTELLQSDNSMP